MAKEEAAATEQAEKPQFSIENVYLKDVSLECPQGAQVFGKGWKPRIDMDIKNASSKLGEDIYEVALRLTITAKEDGTDTKYYLVEVQQAGSFLVKGFSEQDTKRLLITSAPTVLFPYAREAIDDLVTKANFPPLRLAPINFDALLAKAAEQKQAGEAQPDETVQ